MAEITAIIGLSGAAKTLLMSNIAWREYLKGNRRIFANYYLQLDLENHSFKDRQKKKDLNLNFSPIYEPDDLKQIPRTVSARIFLDEIDAFGADNILESGVDSYTYRSKEATATEKYFKKRLRKSNAHAYYTVQQMAMVPVRIREETTTIFMPKVKKWRPTDNPVHPMAPHILHYGIYRRDLTTGKFRNTGKIRNLNHPLGIANHISDDMLNIYDTNADIFFKADRAGSIIPESDSGEVNSVKVDPFRNPVTDESLYQECKKIFNHGTIVEKIAESGRCSEWKGDVIITPPGRPPVILDAVGTREYFKDGITSRYLHNQGKYKAFSEMINIDTIQKSKHYIGYANKRLSKKDKIYKNWFIAPVSDNIAILKEKNKKSIAVKDIINPIPLNELSF